MKILVFTEGTILMHEAGKGLSREEIIKQVENKHPSVHEYNKYIPIKEFGGIDHLPDNL